MKLKQCKFTKNWFESNRNNKRFEDSKARSNYHNLKYRKLYSEVNKINRLLFSNYKLLIKLVGYRDFIKIERNILSRLRYDFSLTTGIGEQDGLKYFLLYDIKLTFITNETILIERYENR